MAGKATLTTAEIYDRHVTGMAASAARAGIDSGDRLADAIAWFLAQAPRGMLITTWRAYRAALLSHLAARLADGRMTPQAHADLEAMLRASRPVAPVRRRGRPRHKGMPPGDRDKILALLHDRLSGNRWAGLLADWLRAGLLTGLRPTEWFGAVLADGEDEGGLWLSVDSHKNDETRGIGPVRRMEISGFAPEDIDLIRRFAATMTGIAMSGDAKAAYDGCRRLLFTANDILWPVRTRTYTLYSARHAWASRAKAMLDRATVAALMGHRSTGTAATHYGRRGTASGVMPAPDPHLLTRVDVHRSVRHGMDRVSADESGPTPSQDVDLK